MEKYHAPRCAKTSLLKRASILIAALVMVTLPHSAFAYTECSRTPARFFVGSGILWVVYAEGGVGTMGQNSPDFKPVFAVILTALTNKQSITVRYEADSLACDSQQSIQGVWMNQH